MPPQHAASVPVPHGMPPPGMSHPPPLHNQQGPPPMSGRQWGGPPPGSMPPPNPQYEEPTKRHMKLGDSNLQHQDTKEMDFTGIAKITIETEIVVAEAQ
ncbi:hypothetical protein OESDEN_25446 [Oesophagostomum dentatum]|uniref:Uncharacterized protein n=1 Tax=Oesophagostomum dentatum TaxID=61180 RepID=A0A0B1RQN1_OESDE|nr:hypothetical protein OESDEN_25446 [Oesophagostomum dentatum]